MKQKTKTNKKGNYSKILIPFYRTLAVFQKLSKYFTHHISFLQHRWQITINFLLEWKGLGLDGRIFGWSPSNVFFGAVSKFPADGSPGGTGDTRRALPLSECAGGHWGSLCGWSVCHRLHTGKVSRLCGPAGDFAGWSRGWTVWSRFYRCMASPQCGPAGELGGLRTAWNPCDRPCTWRVCLLCVSSGEQSTEIHN